jgi:penicillin-binding protein 1B
MYQTIAANGFQTPVRAIRTVTDSQGEALSSYPFQLRQTIDADDVYLIQTAMQEVTHSGTAASIYSVLPSSINTAGKTGTTDDQRDSWFAGFSNNRLAVVWLGLDDNSPLPFTGSGGALRVWKSFMKSQPLESFEAPLPDDIKWLWIDSETGLLSAENCEGGRLLPFISGSEPTEASECMTKPSESSNPVTRSLDWIKDWFQ